MDEKYKDAVISNIEQYMKDDDEELLVLHRRFVDPYSKNRMINEIVAKMNRLPLDEINVICGTSYNVKLLVEDLEVW